VEDEGVEREGVRRKEKGKVFH